MPPSAGSARRPPAGAGPAPSSPNIAFKARATPWRGGPGLAGDAAAVDVDEHVQAVAHVDQRQRADDGAAVLLLGEVLVEWPLVDDDLAVAFGHPDAGHGGLPPAGAEVELLRRAHVRRLPRAGPSPGCVRRV